MNFDLVIYTCATGIDTSSPRNVMRIPCYEAFARAMQGRGRILVVPHYLSVLPEIFSKPKEVIDRTLTPAIHQLAENLYVYTPLVPIKLGLIANVPHLLGGCRWYLAQQVRTTLRKIGGRAPWRVVSVDDPFHFVLLGLVDESLKTYDCLDEYALYGEVEEEDPSTLASERKLAQQVDVVFTTARMLHRKLQQYNPNTFYSPNAVDFELFHQATLDATPVAHELDRIPKPIVGFTGNLNFWFDFGLLLKVVTRRPDWSFVFVGEVADGYPSVRQGIAPIKRLANAHFLGWQQMPDLPSFLKGFDVAILPYNQDRAAQTVNPNKMYQYMAAGVPIVATPTPEIAQFSEVIELASEPDGFIQAIDRCLYHENQTKIARQIAIAQEETWDKRAQQRLSIIERFLQEKMDEGKQAKD